MGASKLWEKHNARRSGTNFCLTARVMCQAVLGGELDCEEDSTQI